MTVVPLIVWGLLGGGTVATMMAAAVARNDRRRLVLAAVTVALALAFAVLGVTMILLQAAQVAAR